MGYSENFPVPFLLHIGFFQNPTDRFRVRSSVSENLECGIRVFCIQIYSPANSCRTAVAFGRYLSFRQHSRFHAKPLTHRPRAAQPVPAGNIVQRSPAFEICRGCRALAPMKAPNACKAHTGHWCSISVRWAVSKSKCTKQRST